MTVDDYTSPVRVVVKTRRIDGQVVSTRSILMVFRQRQITDGNGYHSSCTVQCASHHIGTSTFEWFCKEYFKCAGLALESGDVKKATV